MKKVYVVMGRWAYEGYHEDSLKVFSDKKKADKYSKFLTRTSTTEITYDDADVFEMEVE